MTNEEANPIHINPSHSELLASDSLQRQFDQGQINITAGSNLDSINTSGALTFSDIPEKASLMHALSQQFGQVNISAFLEILEMGISPKPAEIREKLENHVAKGKQLLESFKGFKRAAFNQYVKLITNALAISEISAEKRAEIEATLKAYTEKTLIEDEVALGSEAFRELVYQTGKKLSEDEAKFLGSVQNILFFVAGIRSALPNAEAWLAKNPAVKVE